MSKPSKVVRTTCPYCGVGCGVKVTTTEQGSYAVSGDPLHPANFGRLCTKGRALGDTLDSSMRLGFAQINGEPVRWNKATAYVANRFQKIIKQHGPDAIAFYVSGQLLTEDYYVANKLIKGFIGSNNIDTNSRLCMSSPALAQKKAFGSDTVPVSYCDLEKSDLVVLVGSNLAWCHPVLFQRLNAAKAERPDLKIIVIDPRVTATSRLADYHLAIKSGTDLALFNGLLCYLVDQGLVDKKYFSPQNCQQTIAAARSDFQSVEALAKLIAIDKNELLSFFQLFATNEKVVSVFSQGINQSTMGCDQASAIINCHLITNRIGRPGMGPLAITGQPNAMGGREVGGMATSLAAHLAIEDSGARQLVGDFWQSDKLNSQPGKTAGEIFDAIDAGKIKAVWIMATNPLATMPNVNKIKAALNRCPLVVVSESFATSDTLEYADVIFPAAPWGEKSGTVTNGERRISRQRAFMPAFQQSQRDWWIICQVARAMGFGKAFGYQHESEIFAEYAALTEKAFESTGSFSLAALTKIDRKRYDSLMPFQWPQHQPEQLSFGDVRVFANGKFHTDNGRPNMVPVSFQSRQKSMSNGAQWLNSSSSSLSAQSGHGLLTLNSGRSRDHWHTMTRTQIAERLNLHTAEPFVWINPDDARQFALRNNEFVQLKNDFGESLRKIKLSYQVKRGELFSPMHWSLSNHSGGSLNQLVGDDCDPESKQPAFKQALVAANPIELPGQAMLLTRHFISSMPTKYWARQKVPQGYLFYLADTLPVENLFNRLTVLLQQNNSSETQMHHFMSDENNERHLSLIATEKTRLVGFLTACASHIKLDSSWLTQALTEATVSHASAATFTLRPSQNQNGGSPLCLCVNVNREQIRQAAAQTNELQQICELTGAGKACGSCLGDLALEIAT